MSGANPVNQTSSDDEGEDDFPVAAIVCLAVGGYVLLIVGIILLKQYCSSRGSCRSECCEAKSEEGGCCSCNCCAHANEACPCCCRCNLDGCLSKMCGKPKKINCIDMILCNCGGCTEKICNPFKCCRSCFGDCRCSSCCTGCKDFCANDSEPGTCGCLCLEIKVRSPRSDRSHRRTSAPAAIQGGVHQFNTHSPPHSKHATISHIPHLAGQHQIGKKQFGRGDSGFEGKHSNELLTQRESNNHTRIRSLSHSPKNLSGRRSKHTFLSEDKVSDEIQSSSSKDGSKCLHGMKMIPRTRKESSQQSSIHSKTLNFSNEDTHSSERVSHRKRSARLRRSVRSGQRSQRFPNRVLVSAESLNSSTTTSSGNVSKSQKNGRSLPEPSRGQRPLPAIDRA